MSIKGKWACVAFALIGLVVSACGSSGGGGGNTSGSGGSSGSGVLKVGIICSCSGAYGAAFLPGEEAVVAWAGSVNAQGGVAGHKVQIVKEDDGGNPAQSATAFNSLSSQGVAAIVDLTLVDVAWTAKLATAKIPVFAGPTASLNPMIFWAGQSSSGTSNGQATIAVAKAAGAKNVGIFYCVETATCASGLQSLQTAASAAGLPVAYKGSITTAQPNFTAQCLAAKQAGVQALSIGEQPTTIARAAGDCAKQGYHPIYLGSLISWSPAFAQAPGLKDNSWLSSTNYPYFDTSQPEIKAMDTAFNKDYPGVLNAATTPAELIVEEWAVGLLIGDAAKAAKASGSYTGSEILAGLYKLKGDTLNGLAAPLTFTPGGTNDDRCWFTAHYGGGKYTVDNGGKPTCAS